MTSLWPPVQTEAKAFFESWVRKAFRPDVPWTDLYPTPLGALEALRAEAAVAGIPETELRAAVGDLVSALMQAMLDAPAPVPTTIHLAEARQGTEAMELALNYLDGLRTTVGEDTGTAAELVLHHLARQGFVLRKADGLSEPLIQGETVARPGDLAADLY